MLLQRIVCRKYQLWANQCCTKMKTREENYAAFERMMNREKVFMERDLTFEGICRRIGTEKDALESVLLEELGMRGDAILDKYRETTAP